MAGHVIDTDAMVRIRRASGATQVALFGSFARDEAKPDSDVDLLTESALNPYLRDRIVQEKKVLYDA